MPDLLSQEELLALEEQLAGEEAPVSQPYIAPPGSPQVLPPGPSPEYLRRQAMMMPLRPGTGVAIGPEGIFTSVGEPPPSADMQMMEQLRGQINAMEFKNANDALNAAIQFQHMREAARLRERGTPEEQILQRLGRGLFYQQPNVIPNMMRETRPVPAPSVTNMGGVNVLRSGLRGERATPVPRTALPQEPFTPKTIDVEDGGKVIQLGPNRYQYLKPVPEKETPAAVRERILKHQIEQAQAELQTLPGPRSPRRLFGDVSKEDTRRSELEKQIKEANDMLNSMARGEKTTPSASTPTPITAPATPKTQAEYDALASGSYYIDPTTKATKRKK